MLTVISGSYGKAEKLYEKSLQIKEDLDDQRGVAVTLCQLGMIRMYQGDYEEAEKLYNKSLAIFSRIKDKEYDKVVRRNLQTLKRMEKIQA